MIIADLADQVAIVTGGGSGIGLAISRQLMLAGAKVVVNDLADKSGDVMPILRQACPEADSRMVFVKADISDPETPRLLVAEALAHFGRLDILVNNAATPGGRTPIPFGEIDRLNDDLWRRILETNLISPFRMTRAAAPELKKRRGVVVNTASVAGLAGQASSIPYAASKAGLINLTQNLARALAPDIRVNAVAPGWVDTPWTQEWPEDRRQRSTQGTLLQRLGTADDIAEAMLFLIAGGSYVTGQTLVVDGGR